MERKISGFVALEGEYQDLCELEKLARTQQDESTLLETQTALARLEKRVQTAMLESLLGDQGDQCHCYLEVHSGAGGVDAQDWGEMLVKMYHRWGYPKGLQGGTGG